MNTTDTYLQNAYQQFLFWAHALFILAAISIGFFISPYTAFVLAILHRLHIYLFGECLLSKAQRSAGGLPEGLNFLQLAAKRFFRREITEFESRVLDYSLATSIIILAFIK